MTGEGGPLGKSKGSDWVVRLGANSKRTRLPDPYDEDPLQNKSAECPRFGKKGG